MDRSWVSPSNYESYREEVRPLKLTWKVLFALQEYAMKLRKEEKGQALSEYAIIIGVIAVLVIATLILFKNALVGVFTRIINSLTGVGT